MNPVSGAIHCFPGSKCKKRHRDRAKYLSDSAVSAASQIGQSANLLPLLVQLQGIVVAAVGDVLRSRQVIVRNPHFSFAEAAAIL
jgi:hypothetical protein